MLLMHIYGLQQGNQCSACETWLVHQNPTPKLFCDVVVSLSSGVYKLFSVKQWSGDPLMITYLLFVEHMGPDKLIENCHIRR
jgi:hypothetical protein